MITSFGITNMYDRIDIPLIVPNKAGDVTIIILLAAF